MSVAMMWVALVAVCMTFFLGLAWMAIHVPVLAGIVASLVCYVLIVMAMEMRVNRNRSLLNLAHHVHECTNCGEYVPSGCEPAHANWSEFGKGAMVKANDHWHAALCHRCHAELDQGMTLTREERKSLWQRAHIKTMDLYWHKGWIKVA
jgi:hypothetical protein